jgi:hypothetical protein
MVRQSARDPAYFFGNHDASVGNTCVSAWPSLLLPCEGLIRTSIFESFDLCSLFGGSWNETAGGAKVAEGQRLSKSTTKFGTTTREMVLI